MAGGKSTQSVLDGATLHNAASRAGNPPGGRRRCVVVRAISAALQHSLPKLRVQCQLKVLRYLIYMIIQIMCGHTHRPRQRFNTWYNRRSVVVRDGVGRGAAVWRGERVMVVE